MFENYIEKSRRGEQKGGKYLWREEIAEKVRSSKGKQTIQRYKYYYLEDFLRDSADTILNNIGKFFFKGKEEKETKKIKNAYSKEDIQKNYGADEKTWMQHVFEYFRKKDKWDKRFSDKAVAEKFKKPIKQKVAEKINTLEYADEEKTSVKIVKKETKKKDNTTWKPNPSLMRKVWSLYTGKEEKKEEKENKVVEEVLEKPIETVSNIKEVKEVDWFQAFAGSTNHFYPNGTGAKPYSTEKVYTDKNSLEVTKRAPGKTDLGDVLDGLNDFVYHAEYSGKNAVKNFLARFKEKGFYPQKQKSHPVQLFF